MINHCLKSIYRVYIFVLQSPKYSAIVGYATDDTIKQRLLHCVTDDLSLQPTVILRSVSNIWFGYQILFNNYYESALVIVKFNTGFTDLRPLPTKCSR